MTLRASWAAGLARAIGLCAGAPKPLRRTTEGGERDRPLGRFALNKELSDDAREKMREALEKGGGPGAGPRRGSPTAPGGGPSGTSRAPGAGAPAGRLASGRIRPARRCARFSSRPRRSSSASGLRDHDRGDVRPLEAPAPRRKDVQDRQRKRRGQELLEGRQTARRTRRRGASVTESWERVPDGSRLILMVRIESGPAGKLELKRVYDRAEAAAISPR